MKNFAKLLKGRQTTLRREGENFLFFIFFFVIFFQNSGYYITLKAIRTQKLRKSLPLSFRKNGFIFLGQMSSSFFQSFNGQKKLRIQIEDHTHISSVLVKFENK